MNASSKLLSQTVVQLCLKKGIRHIVLSPGSRNAPLTIGFTDHPDFKNFSIVDERCAAFFALGMAQQLKAPVAVVCTSGSALLNYFPAVAEAFYSDIPLVVLSADRPAHLVEIGDGQTIQQEQVYGNHVLYAANCKEGEAHQVFNETEINVALNTAIELQGPVHINLPFSEPLYQVVTTFQLEPQNVPVRPFTAESLEESRFKDFMQTWNRATKKMILVGVLPPNSIEQQYVDFLAEDPSVLVLTETTSNLHHENFIPAIDQLITALDAEALEVLQPEVLVTFGGMVVSKRIKAFLRKFQPNTHWHVDPKKAYDTFFALDFHYKNTPNRFLEIVQKNAAIVTSSYQDGWLKVRENRLIRHNLYLAKATFSDFTVFAEIFENLPSGIQLQLANSATIRYAQLFDIDPSLEVFCNRGTSGIDGSTSTAIGAAWAVKKQTVFVTGDLSFFYDSNALWNNYIPPNFRIIIVNNSGGGIFRILPGAKESTHFSNYFETTHHLKAKHLSEMFGFEYTSANSQNELKAALTDFFSISEKPKILEIVTPSEVNDRILLDYFDFIA
ncbi:MAG: 2-succinyl-5-enolpyruvyl-6-hydroxy-3-cyclohexene-1-carboxylic-acid synthase [Flavobacteriaceae bacterium]|nr:2-succinyl-5-enolpyruvyl-6-hydroxy-3-cyclohexene-1-carboxylic-acid synthase [Flavobacteriaceae bacterium]|tara:strand:+ start:95792 stop:97462 length:1671 start_codon:yes stop_codon:yes gene_type:complete